MYSLSMATENFRRALELAGQAAAEVAGTDFIGSEHFIYAFLSLPECEAYKILASSGVSKQKYEELFRGNVDKKYGGVGLTPNTQKMYDRAVVAASDEGMKAGTAHVLYEILCVPTCRAARLLATMAEISDIREKTVSTLNALIYRKKHGATDFENGGSHTPPTEFKFQFDSADTSMQKNTSVASKNKSKSSMNRSLEALEGCGVDMTERARRGKMDPVIGRKREIEKVVQVLSRRLKNNPVLVGEPGVGKSAIVEGISQLVVKNQVPDQLINKRIFSVDLPGMLAGTRYRGDFEEKLKGLIDTVTEDGDIILFIDEIHTLVGAGSSSDNNMDAANILKPLLARADNL